MRLAARIAFVVGVAAVIALSLLPQDTLPPTGLWDKLEHFAVYGAVAFAGAIGFPERRRIIQMLLGLIFMGCALEVAQTLVSGRIGSIEDASVNVVGTITGLAIATSCTKILGSVRG